jgi:hypothetical protein
MSIGEDYYYRMMRQTCGKGQETREEIRGTQKLESAEPYMPIVTF